MDVPQQVCSEAQFFQKMHLLNMTR